MKKWTRIVELSMIFVGSASTSWDFGFDASKVPFSSSSAFNSPSTFDAFTLGTFGGASVGFGVSTSWSEPTPAEVSPFGPEIVGMDANYPFSLDLRRYNIELLPSDIDTLNADISAEEYVPCSVTTDYQSSSPTTFQGVGCRYKGQVGSLLHCLDQMTGALNGNCKKLSFKVDCNKYRKDSQKCDGQKQLNFHGMGVDDSQLSERVLYEALGEAGIPAPRARYAELYFNGHFHGLFVLVEDVDTPFGKQNFADDATGGKGPFYKDLIFLPEQLTPKALDKAKSGGAEEHTFVTMVGALLPTMDCNTFNQYFDADSIAKVTAFNDIIGNSDDWRYRHNFFWYVRTDVSGNKRLVMIPWDYDRVDDSLDGATIRAQNIAKWMLPKPEGSECTIVNTDYSAYGAEGSFQREYLDRLMANLAPTIKRPIQCDDLTNLISTCAYNQVLSHFNTFLTTVSPALPGKVDRYAQLIYPTVLRDTAVDTASWQAAVASLKRSLKAAPGKAPGRARYGTSATSSVSTLGTSALSTASRYTTSGSVGSNQPVSSTLQGVIDSIFGGSSTGSGVRIGTAREVFSSLPTGSHSAATSSSSASSFPSTTTHREIFSLPSSTSSSSFASRQSSSYLSGLSSFSLSRFG